MLRKLYTYIKSIFTTPVIDAQQELSTLVLDFKSLGDGQDFAVFLQDYSPKESTCKLLEKYYSYKLGEYINSQNYQELSKLEAILELHKLIKSLG